MIPKEGEGESYEDALARVLRCIGGGAATGNANDSDSDLELVFESVTVNLRCPMSGLRMKTAGRFKPCVHMGCFDLETFVALNERSRKWQCPICLKNYSLENLIIDPYFNRITSLMSDCREEINEMEIGPDGSWRIKTSGQFKDLEKWHLPDGSLCSTLATKPCLGSHAASEIQHKMFMEVDQGETKPSKETLQFETKTPMTESVAGTGSSGLDGQGSLAPEREEEVDVIVLSDSDDDKVEVLSSPVEHRGPGLYNGLGFGMGAPSCLELLTGGSDEFDLSYWDYPNCPPAGLPAGHQQFGGGQNGVQTEVNVAFNGGDVGLDMMADGTSDRSGNWSPIRGGDDLMDHDSTIAPGPGGNLSEENSTAEQIVDAASLLHSMSGGGDNNTHRVNGPTSESQSLSQRSYNPFCPPRQPRSAKRRVILSIDSDSD